MECGALLPVHRGKGFRQSHRAPRRGTPGAKQKDGALDHFVQEDFLYGGCPVCQHFPEVGLSQVEFRIKIYLALPASIFMCAMPVAMV